MVSQSSATSNQKANAQITQQYIGQCHYDCTNSINNVVIDLNNTVLDGGITFSQQCTADANCTMGVNMDATASVLFKARNKATSNTTNNWWTGYIGAVNSADASSYQEINEAISQFVSEQCSVTSSNSINNVVIYATDSAISGGIFMGQVGDSGGSCVLTASMNATANATGTSDNEATSAKKGDKNIIGTVLIIALVFILVSGGVIGTKFLTGKKSGQPSMSSIGK